MVSKMPQVLVFACILLILMLHTHDAGCLPQICYR
jgi:hypothetical protein